MNNSKEKERLDIDTTFLEIRKNYSEMRSFQNLAIFLMGLYGSGKTRFICTGRKPILIHSFDPTGTVVVETTFPEELKRGDILIEPFWKENYKRPKAFSDFEKAFERLEKNKRFNSIGTYAIDSSTFWVECCGFAVSRDTHIRNPQSKVLEGNLEQGDYKVIYNTVKDYVRRMADFNCDFIVTCHMVTVKDETTGAISDEPTLPGKLAAEFPGLFTEKYVIERRGREEPVILTSPKGRARASTQLSSFFDVQERADLKHLLNKAGLPIEDKPNLFGER